MRRSDTLAFTLHVTCGGEHIDLTDCDCVHVRLGDPYDPCVTVRERGLRIGDGGVRVLLTRAQTATLPCGAVPVELRTRRGPITLIADMEPLIVAGGVGG